MLNKNTVSIMVMRNGKPSTFSAVYSASVTSPRYTHLTSNVCAYNVDHRTHAGRSGAGAGVQWVKGKWRGGAGLWLWCVASGSIAAVAVVDQRSYQLQLFLCRAHCQAVHGRVVVRGPAHTTN